MNRDNPNNILGTNTADNSFDSSSVTSNANGSIIERIEYLQGLVAAVTAGQVVLQGAADAGTNSTTEIPIAGLAGYGNDFFNNQWYMQVLCNKNSAGNAPEKQTRMITDYVSATGTFTCDAFGAAVEATDLCLILHESQVAIGSDNNNNVFASTNVAANADGSVLERLEDIKDRLNTVDDYVDTEIAAIKAVADAIPDAGALTALTANVQAVYDRVAGTDSVSNVLGANDADNGFDSSNTAANVDGSVLERLEDLKDRINTVDDFIDTEIATLGTKIDTVDDYIDGANLEKLTSAADGAGNFPAAVVDQSVISKIISKVAGGDTSSYDCTTDSLEAISDGITALTGTLKLDKLISADDRPAALNYPSSVVAESILNFLMSKTLAADSYNYTTDSLEAIADAIAALSTTLKLDKLVSADDSAGATAYPDSVAQDSILAYLMSKSASPVTTSYNNTTDSLEAISDKETATKTAIDNFAAAGGDGALVARKTVTFTNTNADVNLFTVTGGINYKLYAFCTTNVESAGGCNVGVDHNGVVVIADTDCTTLEANDIWHDASPDASVELDSVAAKRIGYGGTILIDVEAAKQVDSGVITFVLVYTPLTADGAVAVAA